MEQFKDSRKHTDSADRWTTLVSRILHGSTVRTLLHAASALIEGALEAATLALVAFLGVAVLDGGEIASPIPFLGEVSEGKTLALLVCLIAARFCFGCITGYLSSVISTSTTVRIREKVLAQFTSSSFSEYNHHSDAEIQQLIVVWPQQVGSLTSTFLSHLSNAIIMTIMLTLAFFSAPLASVLMLGIVFGMTLLFLPIRRAISRASISVMESQKTSSEAVFQLASLRLESDAFGVTDRLSDGCKISFAAEARARLRSLFTKSLVAPLYTAFTYLLIAVGLLGVARIEGLEIGSLGPIFLIVLRSLGYGQGLQQAGSTLSTLRPIVNSIDTSGAMLESSALPKGDLHIGSVASLSVENVSFSYAGGSGWVLKDVSLSIQRGDRVGIVGPSGCGKSTLVKILLGLLPPSSGHVLLNGVSLVRLRQEDLRARTAFVPQKVGTLSATVDENVRFLRNAISDGEIRSALVMADLLSDAEALESGVRTTLSSSRDTLSGGQTQRMGIARALAGGPDVLVLDEPTSSVDRASERAIVDSLRTLPSSTTLVMVSHRLELLRDCSVLVVMDGGQIVEVGEPSVLFQTSHYLRGLEFES